MIADYIFGHEYVSNLQTIINKSVHVHAYPHTFCILGQTEWAEVRLQRMIEEHQVVVHELEAEKKERQRLSEV